jgi:hypothetical protein
MPELTLVMGGSNDNYGGEVYREVETTPTSPFKLRCERSFLTIEYAFRDIDYEVIFVVWNEDPDRESILDWEFLRHPRIRLVVVSPELAKSVESDYQFHETWAKNVGIRRARSEMILCTNPDVLWADPFPRSALEIDSVMIAHRWTLSNSILDHWYLCGSVENFIEHVKIFMKSPDHRRNPDWDSNGDFTLMPKSLWYKLHGLSTPSQGKMGGVDIQTVRRAQTITGKLYKYPNDIAHVEHCGRKLDGSLDNIYIRDDFGFPDKILEEYVNGQIN